MRGGQRQRLRSRRIPLMADAWDMSLPSRICHAKFLRRFLPSHDSIRENRYVAWFGPRLQHHNLWHLHRRSVAGGVAVGLFAGLIPGSNPVQFAAGALLAVAFRVNLPVTVLVTLYSNPFTIVPLYSRRGRSATWCSGRHEGAPPVPLGLDGKRLGEWLPAVFHFLASIGKPLLAGLPLLALLLAAVRLFRRGPRVAPLRALRVAAAPETPRAEDLKPALDVPDDCAGILERSSGGPRRARPGARAADRRLPGLTVAPRRSVPGARARHRRPADIGQGRATIWNSLDARLGARRPAAAAGAPAGPAHLRPFGAEGRLPQDLARNSRTATSIPSAGTPSTTKR